jgi:hypothetical protein
VLKKESPPPWNTKKRGKYAMLGKKTSEQNDGFSLNMAAKNMSVPHFVKNVAKHICNDTTLAALYR